MELTQPTQLSRFCKTDDFILCRADCCHCVRGVELEGRESVQVQLLGRYRQRAVDAGEEVQEVFGASGRHPDVRTCHWCRWRRPPLSAVGGFFFVAGAFAGSSPSVTQ